MKRFALLAVGMFGILSAAGCCCHQPAGPCGYGGCPPGGAPGMYQSGYHQTFDSQTAMAGQGRIVSVTPVPVAMGPIESLPTY